MPFNICMGKLIFKMLFEILEVVSYSGSREEEIPLRFLYQGQWWEVVEIVDRWLEGSRRAGGPVYRYYKVLSQSNRQFILRYNSRQQIWSVLLN